MGSPHELKATAIRDRIVEVRCERPQDVIDAVSELPSVREAALFGAGIHAVLSEEGAADAGEAEREIREALERLGVAVRGVERILPDMEDVFVSLIEEVDRGGNGGTGGSGAGGKTGGVKA